MGTSISALVEKDAESHGPVYTPRESAHEGLIETGKGIRIYPFATEHAENRVQPFLHVARKGRTKPHNDSHEGQEFIFVIRGVLQVRVGHVQYNLREGDSLYFDAMDDHECTPMTDEAEYLDIFA
jgi:quercetin dioxygenase-like cupin family protein